MFSKARNIGIVDKDGYYFAKLIFRLNRLYKLEIFKGYNFNCVNLEND